MTGEHERTVDMIERYRNAFAAANAALNSQFPYFQAQALLTEAKALRDVGRYADALDLLYHERKLRALIDDLLGQVWSLLEEARIRKFRREFESAMACLDLASHYVAGTDLHEYRARIADQKGDIHCSKRELRKAEANYKLAQETADASGQLWLQAHVGNSIARLRLLQDVQPRQSTSSSHSNRCGRTLRTTENTYTSLGGQRPRWGTTAMQSRFIARRW